MAAADVETLFNQIRDEKDIFHKAKLLHKLQKEEDVPLKFIAEGLDLKPAYICHLLRLNRIPEIIVDGYYSSLISMSHLFIISRVKDVDVMVQIYEKILADGLNAVYTEKLVREHLHGVKTEGDYLPAHEREKYRHAGKKDGTHINIDINQSRIKTRLTVEVKGSLQESNNILRRLMTKVEEWRREEGI